MFFSKAIITYMMNQYAPANQQRLYPRDPAARALVDQRLYFDSQFFASLKGIVVSLRRHLISLLVCSIMQT